MRPDSSSYRQILQPLEANGDDVDDLPAGRVSVRGGNPTWLTVVRVLILYWKRTQPQSRLSTPQDTHYKTLSHSPFFSGSCLPNHTKKCCVSLVLSSHLSVSCLLMHITTHFHTPALSGSCLPNYTKKRSTYLALSSHLSVSCLLTHITRHLHTPLPSRAHVFRITSRHSQ